MYGCASKKTAQEFALKAGVFYGYGIFPNASNQHLRWYTGTKEQLEKIGVIDIIDPKQEDV